MTCICVLIQKQEEEEEETKLALFTDEVFFFFFFFFQFKYGFLWYRERAVQISLRGGVHTLGCIYIYRLRPVRQVCAADTISLPTCAIHNSISGERETARQ